MARAGAGAKAYSGASASAVLDVDESDRSVEDAEGKKAQFAAEDDRPS